MFFVKNKSSLTAASLFSLLFLFCAPIAEATDLPQDFRERVVVSNLNSPTAMAVAPDGRIFVALQGGSVRIVENDILRSQPFLSLSVNNSDERGLLGLAFDPNYASNRYFYVFYSRPTGNVNRLSRFRASSSNRNVVDSSFNEQVLLTVTDTRGFHNGGALKFGTDNMLYVAIGDGGADRQNAQRLSSIKGKILRLNPRISAPYIPSDNPFVNNSGARGEIWSYGLRNPFTFDIDPVNGNINANDVGLSSFEEVNRIGKGRNFGWPTCEGSCDRGFTNPIYSYARNSGSTRGCTVIGAAFYRGNSFPSQYRGSYFFADYCSNWIKRLNTSNQMVNFATNGGPRIVDLETGQDGSLYVLSRGSNALRKITYTGGGTGNRGPEAVLTATPQQGNAPLRVNFNASGSSDPDGDPLTYRWDFGNGTTRTGSAVQTYTYQQGGTYESRVTVSDPSGAVDISTRTINVQVGTNPIGRISSPAAGTEFKGGDTINFSGTATDNEDGTLPASAFTWWVEFLHHPESHPEHHQHPILPRTSGSRSGSFTVARDSHVNVVDTWFRIYLETKDSNGQTHETFRDVKPKKTILTLRSNPQAIELTLDGQPQVQEIAAEAIVGTVRNISAPVSQTIAGEVWDFVSWSNGANRSQVYTVPDRSSELVATYEKRGGGTGETKIISPSSDSYVQGGSNASRNFGTSNSLRVKKANNEQYDYRGLMKFPLSTLRTGEVVSARLVLHINNLGATASNVGHRLYATHNGWSERYVTYRNIPGVRELVSQYQVNATGTISLDVTNVLKSRLSGTEKNISFMLQGAAHVSGDSRVYYSSRESSSQSYRPRLEVTYR